jgi:hypothetical protein
MVYVRLDSGREYLFIGDVAWTLANITQFKLRPANTMRRISEDAAALTYQLHWIKDKKKASPSSQVMTMCCCRTSPRSD